MSICLCLGSRLANKHIIGVMDILNNVQKAEFGALYTPVDTLNDKKIGFWIRDISVVVGKLAGFSVCKSFPPYNYDDTILVKYEDYYFYNNCPLKTKTQLGFLLFSINYAIEFIDQYFVNEIPQKFKFAYLQYYYLCDFIKELNA